MRRIWCVGRNYEEHIREMGHDVRDPPFFFAKPADAIVPDGATVPYPPLTKDMHHEVELVVALKSGGRNIKLDKALDCIWGYGVGIDLTRRDLQIASRDMKRPWEIGKAFDASAPCGPLQPADKIGHPSKGRIALKVNGQVRQDGDLAQMIWNVPEVIVKLSRDGRARSRRHHHDRHALGRGRHRRRRPDRMRDRGRGHADGDDRTAGEVADGIGYSAALRPSVPAGPVARVLPLESRRRGACARARPRRRWSRGRGRAPRTRRTCGGAIARSL